METVHGDSHSLVSLLGDGTVGHSTGLKSCDNRVNILHFLYWQGFLRIIKVHQPAKILDTVLLIDRLGIFFK